MQDDRLGKGVSLVGAGYRLLSLEVVWLANGFATWQRVIAGRNCVAPRRKRCKSSPVGRAKLLARPALHHTTHLPRICLAGFRQQSVAIGNRLLHTSRGGARMFRKIIKCSS